MLEVKLNLFKAVALRDKTSSAGGLASFGGDKVLLTLLTDLIMLKVTRLSEPKNISLNN